MNKDRKNKAYFQETFDEMHAPEGLRRKVMDMTKKEAKNMGMTVGKKLAVAAAIAAVLFAGSNGMAYAMTGSTWMETVAVRFNINGAFYEGELNGELNEDGTVTYSGLVETPEGAVATVIDTDSEWMEQDYYVTTDTTVEIERTEVVEEDGRTYFIDGDVKLDITEDMADGTATGSYEKNGANYQYEVKEEPGVPGCYELHIRSEE